ncbi:MAG: VWA domain-containing protein [Mariprofundales bacterium]
MFSDTSNNNTQNNNQQNNNQQNQELIKSVNNNVNILQFGWHNVQNDDTNNTMNSALSDSLLRRNFLVVLDGSGSMKSQACGSNISKYQSAKDALEHFITALHPDDNLGLVAFDSSGISLRLAMNNGIKHHNEFVQQVKQVQANSDTPLGKAINVAFNELRAQAKRQLGYGDYHLVIVTDGIANDKKILLQEVRRVLNRSPIVLTTIGFCIKQKHALNQSGQTIYKEARNTDELVQGLEAIAAEADSFQDMSQFK